MVQFLQRFLLWIKYFWFIYLVIYLSGVINVNGFENDEIREFLPKKRAEITTPSLYSPRNTISYNRNTRHTNVKRDVRYFTEYGSVDGPCRNFIEGDMKLRLFTTPKYDDKYPNRTDCVRVIEAPKDHLILLDFREYFELEQSLDCKFDYLEVRDGAHGYSDLIGIFCGVGFPDMITSSGRYLWLHFHSDDSIELRGFKAVYDFRPRPTNIPPELDMCEIRVGDVEGILNKTDIPEERIQASINYSLPLDCMWVITVKENWKIQLTFLKYKLDRPNECENNFIDVFSNKTDIPSRLKNFCGSIPDSVTSKSNIMFIRFYAAVNALNSTFAALYTAYRERGDNVKNCNDDEYDCQDNTCIDASLQCNQRINCRYRWDETECILKKKIIAEHIIIIMVVFCLIVSGMCAAFIFNCVRKLMRDHRLIQEHIRQSRENRLDEIKSQKKKSSSKDDLKSTISLIVPPTAVTMPPSPLTPCQAMPGRISPTDSLHSSNSQGFPIPNPCYVPSRGIHQDLIPVLKDTSTGTINIGDEMAENVPEMCDMACQTRESLFTQTPQRSLSTFSGGNNSNHNNNSYGWKVQATQHSPESSKHNSNDLSQTKPRQQHPFRAEVAIEVQQQQQQQQQEKSASPGQTTICHKQHRPQQRPYSVQTTKSAPDVIVTH